MALKTFKLSATVSSANLEGVRVPLEHFLGPRGSVERTPDSFEVQATIVGVEARELNRQLLSAMRRTEKSTRMHSEWTSDGVTEKFVDYVFTKDHRKG
jgi:hypothetical protein